MEGYVAAITIVRTVMGGAMRHRLRRATCMMGCVSAVVRDGKFWTIWTYFAQAEISKALANCSAPAWMSSKLSTGRGTTDERKQRRESASARQLGKLGGSAASGRSNNDGRACNPTSGGRGARMLRRL
ncbi:unnamed protein product [Symbiodinium natans]|uniref:Uncharacterized protein n=1 Tax=Symbiodinium natans TaxID=878477 RepID=A0A812GPL6_9DINO|nr:unnamed protein product [Symbiodinium natans]